MRRFDCLIFSGEVRRAKPEPEIYQRTINCLGVKHAEALFVDDREENLRAASALGITGIRVQSLEHQFRIKELRDMFGPLVLSPQLPERTSLQQAQGAAKPLHVWPGESAQEMARNFDQLLDRIMRTAKIGDYGNAD